MRVVGVVLLTLVFLYSVYGFMASGEPGIPRAWRVGYACVGIVTLGGALWIAKSGSRK
jgi:hypothetical protein